MLHSLLEFFCLFLQHPQVRLYEKNKPINWKIKEIFKSHLALIIGFRVMSFEIIWFFNLSERMHNCSMQSIRSMSRGSFTRWILSSSWIIQSLSLFTCNWCSDGDRNSQDQIRFAIPVLMSPIPVTSTCSSIISLTRCFRFVIFSSFHIIEFTRALEIMN